MNMNQFATYVDCVVQLAVREAKNSSSGHVDCLLKLILILLLVVFVGFLAVKFDDSKCRIPIRICFALTLGVFFWKLFEVVLG